MQFSGLSDFASALKLQDNTRFLRQQLLRAGEELTTGQSADIREATRGSYGPVFGLDRALSRIEQRQTDLSDASGRAAATQSALERMQQLGQNFGDQLAAAVARDDFISAELYIRDADAELQAANSALSVRYGDRYIFSGAAEDRPPLAPPANMVADVQAIIAGAPDAATALANIDTYFQSPGGGFETAIYDGATQDGPAVELTEGNWRDYMVRADAPEVRSMLQGLTMAAAYSSTDFGGSMTERKAFLTATAEQVSVAADDVVSLRAVLGTSEQLISEAQTSSVAEKNALTIARSDMVGVDQYEATAQFVSLQAQLETLYNVTSRLSALRFTNYLR